MNDVPKSVGIVEPLSVFRIGIETLLRKDGRFCVAWSVSCPAEASRHFHARAPDLILSEAAFPSGMSVLNLLDEIRRLPHRIPVLTYSLIDERVLAPRVLHSGARGYLMKSSPPEALLHAIDTVLSGRVSLSPEMTDIALNALTPGGSMLLKDDSLPGLTNREMEVLQMVGEGMRSREIATALGISARTVDTHRSRIREKLDLSHHIGLIAFASHWMAVTATGTDPEHPFGPLTVGGR